MRMLPLLLVLALPVAVRAQWKYITNLGAQAFMDCSKLRGVYFQGNAPSPGSQVFLNDILATVYYLPGTTGWGAKFGGLKTALWSPPSQITITNVGVQTNQLAFTIAGTTNLTVVVQACADLANPIWSPVGTNTLTDGAAYFSDAQWTNYPARFYRLRSP